jgi:CheY-like chemotaxis protein
MTASLSILVVDDNPSMATSLVDVLDVTGFQVYLANSGSEALAILQSHPVDVMLTDVRMPDMDGLALYRKTRQPYPRLITMLMTAYAADEIIQQGMKEGIKTILTKPLDISYLISYFSAISRMRK